MNQQLNINEENIRCPCHQDSWVNNEALYEHLVEHYRAECKKTEIKYAQTMTEKCQLEELFNIQHGDPDYIKRSRRQIKKERRDLAQREATVEKTEKNLVARLVAVRLEEIRIQSIGEELARKSLELSLQE